MRGFAGVVLAAGLGLALSACGASNDCTEKATCPDPADGSTATDGPKTGEGSSGGSDARGDTGGAVDGGGVPEGSTLEGSAGCSGACVDAVPTGWSGPVVVYAGSTSAPTCPSAYPTDAYDGMSGLSAGSPACSCACSAATGAQCGASGVEFYTDPSCQTPCDGSLSVPQGLCVTTGCTGNPGSVTVTPPAVAYAGSCTPQPSSSIPPVTWSTSARACGGATTTAGCGGSSLCIPTPASPFGQVCIFQAGSASCPAGAYSSQSLFYGGDSDSRACSGCSCGTPSGVSCSGAQLTLYSQGGTCGGTTADLPEIGGCQTIGVTVNGEEETTAPTATNGTCEPGGGTPSGTATPANPTTLCCVP